MSDAAAAPATPKSPKSLKAVKKVKKVKKACVHPPYIEMVTEAIVNSGERKGISRQAITKSIGSTHNVSTQDNVILNQIKLAIKRGVASNVLKQLKGTGASGSFKVASTKDEPKKKKPAVKSSRVKKPKAATKKSPKKTKKVVKKVVVKKTVKAKPPKKVVKKVAKKVTKPKKKVAKKAAPKKK